MRTEYPNKLLLPVASTRSLVSRGSLLKIAEAFLTATVVCVVSGCAAEPSIVDHTFQFDARWDSPGVQVLDFRYGQSKFPGARNPDYLIREGRSYQQTAITGPMKRPDSLYVKWKTLSDGKIYEDTVDLRKRLPRDFTDSTVYFLIKGQQLYVYLISPERRPADVAPNGPPQYRNRQVVTLYPDKP